MAEKTKSVEFAVEWRKRHRMRGWREPGGVRMSTFRCKSYAVTQIMVGLHRVGVVGLPKALLAAEEAGLSDREAIVDRIVEALAGDNYVPAGQMEAYRGAMWREYLRHRGEDISELFSEVEVIVRGESGEERDRFVDMTRSVFAEFELKPIIAFAPESDDGPNPQLLISDHVVVQGMRNRGSFKSAVHKSFSAW
jgi:hypothetical protein